MYLSPYPLLFVLIVSFRNFWIYPTIMSNPCHLEDSQFTNHSSQLTSNIGGLNLHFSFLWVSK